MATELIKANSVGVSPVVMVGHKVELSFVHTINTVGTSAYVQLFDANTTNCITVGTTIPDYVVKSPASDPSGQTDLNVIFQNGLVVASTSTALGGSGVIQHIRVAVR